MALEFEWDEAKRAANLVKHGIDFREVVAFDLAAAVIVPDRRRDYREARYRAYLRLDGFGRVLAFTWRGRRLRVISLRRARERELKRHGI